MEYNVIKEPDLVVALDIGSTYSGYAWQWRSDFLNNRSHVEFNTNWGSGAYQMHKTSTCILLEYQKEQKAKGVDSCKESYEDYRIEAFGHEAECIFKFQDKERDNYFLLKWFKHYLYRKGPHDKSNAEDKFDRPVPLKIVMAKFIESLKDHFIRNLETKGQNVNLEKTLWVITVPAIWSNEAKSFMRKAAEKSGIEYNKLLLALEPEAAALSCILLPAEQRENMNDLGTPGHMFLTADLGGLTADLYAVQVREDGTLSEVCMAEGELAGGQNVNNAFFQVCLDSFEGNTLKQMFRKANPTEMMEMEDDFEHKKVGIGSSNRRAQKISLKVPHEVRKAIENKTVQLKQAAKVGNKIMLINDTIIFDSDFVRNDLFKESCEVACKPIKEALEKTELEECRALVLVGGFAQSPIVVQYITEMIEEKFPNISVVVPTSPFQAVLKGAVLFGHDPMIFRSRISRFTYGVDTYSLFKEGIHDPSKKVLNTENKKYYCTDLLSVHVHKGQSVILKEDQKQLVYHPLYKYQKRITFGIYSSTKVPLKNENANNSVQGVMYTTEEGCHKLGEVEVETPDTSLGTNRNIMVWMIYGGTELSVFVKDETSGNEARAEITFTNI